MNADERESLECLFEQAVGAVYEVANTLGAGFLEKVYERALVKELMLRGIHGVGEYFADILVEDKLVIELKCVDRFCDEHLAQCLNYLRAAGLKLALLVNFQHPKVQWKRVVYNL